MAGPTGAESGAVDLTPREREVLEAVSRWKGVKPASVHLGRDYETVRFQFKTLRKRIGAKSMIEAIRIWDSANHPIGSYRSEEEAR